MAASPFQFGGGPAAPPASPFGFSTANAAAAPASSAPAFGAAASAPAFGAPSSTAPSSFSFGNAAAAAPAATPAFGTTFGAAAAAKPPAFGAPSTGGAFSFPSAAPAASAPSLFGATSAAAFGAPTTAPSLFGATTAPAMGAPAATPSLFGTAPAAAGTTTGGLFGAPAATTAANIFGQPQQPQQQQQQTNVFGAAGQAQLPGLVDPSGLTQDDAVRSLTRLAAAYTPSSPDFRFQTLFVSVVERPEQRVKPPGAVDENKWRAALAAIKGPNNPQKLWPVVANGFADLNTRSRMQAEAVAQNAARLRELQDRAAALSRRATSEFRSRVSGLQREHTNLSHRLLHMMRCLDALESRLALSAGYNAQQSRQQVAELNRQMGRLEDAVAPPAAAAGLQRRLEAIAAAARMRAGSADGGAAGGGSGMSVKFDDRSQAQLFAVLRDHAEGVRQLKAVLKEDELDLQILNRLTTGGGGAGSGMGMGMGSELTSAAMGGR
ncbi:hypothetical protein PLESTB_001157800 [Pleodorina starrii]|uniref:Nucleoporin Nup54 alpha-helical domain-containing protein n=1 Tax=Pleodorina starrii TaxID=330485 RepID=A0A9W6BRF2_9CHLO|nr:hypothetical protein PLESTM_001778100 [Pleodorina starrii]GLC56867.1 hypothetical protein PLESTB_001157800 [Pleodorina starrii]GLC68202.1 hypothetical protein PLESTF_000659600 [Pleodorina starrii]